jgi:hypothetical protein
MKNIYYRTIPLILLIITTGFYTTLPSQTEIEESLLENHEDDSASEILVFLQELRQHHIDINQTSLRTLNSLPFLSPLQVRSIIRERKRNGPFKSWSNFRQRLNLPIELCNHLKSYISIRHTTPENQNQLFLRLRIQGRVQRAAGYRSGAYSGSPWKSYGKIAIKSTSSLRGVLLVEKDPGEVKWNDLTIGYIETDRFPGLTRLVLGHFKAEIADGLVFWGPYGFKKGSDPLIPAKQHSRGILGYSGSHENDVLTGIAAELKIHSSRFTFIASRTYLDAILNPDETIKSLPSSGLHRTKSEIKSKDTVIETVLAGRVQHSLSCGSLGMTACFNRYSRIVNRDDPVRSHFSFQGKDNHIIGFDYDLYFNRIYLSGEMALCRSGGWALTSNGLLEMTRAAFIVSFRWYHPEFYNSRSTNFGSHPVCNEKSTYLGFTGKITSSIRFSFYYDLIRRPWRSYLIPVPVTIDDLFFQIRHKIYKLLTIYLQLRLRKKDILQKAETTPGYYENILADRSHQQIRLDIYTRIFKKLKLKTRLEMVTVNYPELDVQIPLPSKKEKGWLLYQDIHLQPLSCISVSARLIGFKTSSYDSRIYEFENDLPCVMAILPVYMQGSRWYLLIKYKLTHKFMISVKFSTTIHYGADKWGSGYDRIQGNLDQRFGMQMDLQL